MFNSERNSVTSSNERRCCTRNGSSSSFSFSFSSSILRFRPRGRLNGTTAVAEEEADDEEEEEADIFYPIYAQDQREKKMYVYFCVSVKNAPQTSKQETYNR